MVKLNYKGNLNEDIIDANREYSFFNSNKYMILLDLLLSLGMLVIGFNLNMEDVNAYFMSIKTFAICSVITLLKGFREKSIVNKKRRNAQARIDRFSERLSSNIKISSNDIKSAVVSEGVIVNSSSEILDNVMSYQINIDNKKRMLVEMKNELAQELAKFKLRGYLILSCKVEEEECDSEYGLYLTEEIELPVSKNNVKSLVIKK